MIYEAFFDSVRASFGALAQKQVDGFNKIIAEAEKRNTPLKHLAYMLATVWHETAKTMQPVREYGSEAYLKAKKYYPWVGEGLVQVTWEENHRKFGATKPGQLMEWPIALRALFDGMSRGMFTGKKLADYINDQGTDYYQARRIVNGLDRADTIRGYAMNFEKALLVSDYGDSVSEPVEPTKIEEPTKPTIEKPSIQTVMAAIIAFIIAAIIAFIGFNR